jgi:hypothetical protein
MNVSFVVISWMERLVQIYREQSTANSVHIVAGLNPNPSETILTQWILKVKEGRVGKTGVRSQNPEED